ncbi:MAG TPA: nucleotide exchange factor GrpE [Bacteroidia bacterium]|nr:nucleotide exchange factor GrpE [Bacteroidia bacterium]
MTENKDKKPVNTEQPETDEQQHELPGEPENESAKKIAELEEQVSTLNDKYLRLYSEFDNFRKRTAKERVEILSMAGADMIKSLLPVIDDFERALRNNEKATDVAAVNEGVNLIAQKFRSILASKGLEPLESLGKPFDVDMHEAITNIPAPSEELKGKVVDEVEKGYMLNGKVIRFAKVVVGS